MGSMNLTIPTSQVTVGPDYAAQLQALLALIEEHDHSTGKGVKVTPSGLNINADVEFNGNDATELVAILFNNSGSVDTTKTRSLQVVSGEIYWVDSSGNSVQLTSGGVIARVIRATTPATASFPLTLTSTADHTVQLIDTTSARTITLPAASNKMYFKIKDKSGSAASNNITINRAGSDTIDGGTSYLISSNYGSIDLVSDGVSAWHIV